MLSEMSLASRLHLRPSAMRSSYCFTVICGVTLLASLGPMHSHQVHAQSSNSPIPTFYRDVLPILENHCQSCHRPGEIGPMPLLTYERNAPVCPRHR